MGLVRLVLVAVCVFPSAFSLSSPFLALRGGAQEEGVLCRLKKGGIQFEVLCHPAKIEQYREGAASKDDVLMSPEIFKDIKKGDRPSAAEIERAFEHTDVDKAIEQVLLKGDFQLSVAERKKKTDEKLAQIISFIGLNYMEPKSNLPIPRTRIVNGIDQLKGLKLDPFRSTATQADEIVKRLKEQFPLIKNEVFGQVSVDVHLAASTAAMIHSSNACQLVKDEYTDDAYIANIRWLCNDYSRLVGELTKSTGGQYELTQEIMSTDTQKAGDKSKDPAAKRKAQKQRGNERDDKRSQSAGLDPEAQQS